METAKQLAGCLEKYQDPNLVWQFQNFFGVEKVQTIERKKGQKFIALEVGHDKKGEKKDNPTEDKWSDEESDDQVTSENIIYYLINNRLWQVIFLFGSQLGDETYYAIFFSFWFWNIDGAVGRRVVLVWNLIMYIGQGMKDILRLPRPAMPPVVQLESKWALEYGMPSTHAMVGLAVPCSILFFTHGRYVYPFPVWSFLAVTWCALVCCSRLYLGMHTVADIIGGLIFSSFLLVFIIPIADWSDEFILTSPYAPFVTIGLSLLGIIFYPGCDRWTPARGDTTVILGSYLGIQLGFWLNYQTGVLKGPPIPPPYPILWPNYEQYGETLLRMAVGGVMIIATRAIFKPLTYHSICALLGVDASRLRKESVDVNNKPKLVTELTTKLVTYVAIGVVVMYLAPLAFRTIGCERATFHTEV